MYDKLVAKLNNNDTSAFVLKTKYDTDISNLEKDIYLRIFKNTSKLLKKQIIMLKLMK